VALRTKDGVATLSDLVRSSLRLRPDRIPIGEVRGAEALDLLKAWGTGHPGGIGTIHAGSAIGALRRMEQLIQEAVVTVPRALIAETIDLIAVLSGRGSRPAPHRTRPRHRARRPRAITASAVPPPHPQPEETLMIRPFTACARRPPMPPPRLRQPDASPARPRAGSGMPWEAPLQAILESIEGPVAKIVAVIIIIVTGLTLAFGDTSGGFRRLIQIVFGLSIAFAAELLPELLQLRRRGADLMAPFERPMPSPASPSRSTAR
jgi:type IV secretory pathway VirB2 component (pilin)